MILNPYLKNYQFSIFNYQKIQISYLSQNYQFSIINYQKIQISYLSQNYQLSKEIQSIIVFMNLFGNWKLIIENC